MTDRLIEELVKDLKELVKNLPELSAGRQIESLNTIATTSKWVANQLGKKLGREVSRVK